MAGEKEHFYSRGSRIPLTPARGLVAVDAEKARRLIPSARTLKRLLSAGRSLRGGVILVPVDNVPANVASVLEGSGALHPVFKHEDAFVVVLPEVRVETRNAAQRRLLFKFLEQKEIPSEVVRERGETLVLRPLSGLGMDALRLANRLHEAVHVEMAQARFVRMVPKPK